MDQELLLGIDLVIEFEGMTLELGIQPYMDIVLDRTSEGEIPPMLYLPFTVSTTAECCSKAWSWCRCL